MKSKVKQFYSIMLNKKTNVFIALALGIFILLTILIGGILMNFFGGMGLKDMQGSVYEAMLMIIDPGFLAVDRGFIVGAISLLVVLVGMIVFLGGSIGYITAVLSNFMDGVKGGSKKVYLYDHMLILNWNSRAIDIFTEECYKGENKNMFILVNEGRDEVAAQIRQKRAQLKKEDKNYHPINCFVREGDLFSGHELLDAGVERASSIIILDDENSGKGEQALASMIPIKILMLLSKMKLGKDQTIIVESADQWTKSLIEDIHAESEDEIVAVSTNEILGKMLAQISIMPELNDIYGELMSHKGNEFYSMATTYAADDKYSGIEAFLDTHAHGVPLNIMEVDGENRLFAMGENPKVLQLEGGGKPEVIKLKLNKNYVQRKRNIVIIGKNSKQNYLYDCYDQYVIEHGEETLHIDRISTEEGLDMVRDKTYISEYEISSDLDKKGIQEHLRRILGEKKVDTILLLSNDMDDAMGLDTEVLVDLVNVKRMIMDTDQEPELVVEILDPRHLDIASHYGIKSIVFSNRYVSRLITQFGDSRSLYYFFSDLFDYDSDLEEVAAGRYRSKEIYVRTASRVYEELPPRLSQRNLLASTYYSSPQNNPLNLLGYIKADTEEMILFGSDMDEKMIKLEAEDKVILYCRH